MFLCSWFFKIYSGLTFSHIWHDYFISENQHFSLVSSIHGLSSFIHSNFSHPQIEQACSLVNSPSLGASLSCCLSTLVTLAFCFYYLKVTMLLPVLGTFDDLCLQCLLLTMPLTLFSGWLTDLKSNVVCPRTSSLA